MKVRKKPVIVDAIQLCVGSNEDEVDDLHRFFGDFINWSGDDTGIVITTLEGDHFVSPGDWIIKGIKGEFYPCKPDVFEMTYEKVEE